MLMSRHDCRVWLVVSMLCARCWCVSAAATLAEDRDADGLADQLEVELGLDPAQRDVLQSVLADGVESESARARPTYDATKDVVDVAMCHVGDDRYLWQVTFAQVPRMEDTVLHLYLDADADETTGRQGSAGAPSTGTDYMLSIVRGRASAGFYEPTGTRRAGPVVSIAVQDRTVLVTADCAWAERTRTCGTSCMYCVTRRPMAARQVTT